MNGWALKEYDGLQVLYDELEQECLIAVRYIEACQRQSLSSCIPRQSLGTSLKRLVTGFPEIHHFGLS